VLSKARDAADDLVQATHLRAMERMDQFARERALTGLVAISSFDLVNQMRSQRIREGGGLVDAEDTLISDGARNGNEYCRVCGVKRRRWATAGPARDNSIHTRQGYSYAETVAALGLPIGTIMSRLAAGRAVLAKLK
jgi:RNA polymerase sigma-70 factor (ECF subfamily)